LKLDLQTYRWFAVQGNRTGNRSGLDAAQDEFSWLGAVHPVNLIFDFVRRDPDAPDTVEEIRAAIMWCDVHERTLVAGQAYMASGVYEMPGFVGALDSQFSFGYGFWRLVCPDCVAACQDWVQATAANVED
jgi:hypothetical protein